MVFTLDQATDLQKEVSTGRYIKPSKIQGEIRVRLFGKGISGYEAWTNDDKPIRWESKPAALPENIREEPGRDPLKRFVAAIAWDYEAGEFRILQLTQKTLISDLMGLLTDSDWGPECDYDIKISRKGEGLKTEYDMKPVSKKPPSKESSDAFDALDCDLSKLFDGEDPFGQSV